MAALWLRSIRRRPGAATGVFLLVLIVCASAVAGPMLVRAAEQSELRTKLHGSAPGRFDIVVTAQTAQNPIGEVAAAVTTAAGAAGPLYTGPVTIERSARAHTWRVSNGKAHEQFASSLDDECDAVVITSGRCPRLGEVLVPVTWHARPGSSVSIVGTHARFPISGSYAQRPRFAFGLGAATVLMTESTLTGLDPEPKVSAYDHLRVGVLDLDRLADALASVRAVRAAVLRQTVVSTQSSQLPGLASTISAESRVATVVGLLTVVPLVMLCWYTLVLVMQLIAVVRSRDWALGRLRGLPVPAWLRSLYAEPVALLAGGAVCGCLAGVGVAAVTVHLSMAPGTPLEPWRLPVLACFGGSVLGAITGIVIGTVRAVRLPLATLLQQSAESVRLSRWALAAQLLVFAAAVLAFVQLSTQRQVTVGAGDLGVLFPGLLAAVIALAAIRIGSRIVRSRNEVPPASVRRLVIGRRLARNPTLLGRYVAVAVATAVATFTISLMVIMHRNVQLRAENHLGAAQVVHVAPVPASRLIAAVRRADPSGHDAMAVQQLAGTQYGGTSRIVAADVSRLSAVSYWNASWAGLTAAQTRRLLAPAHAPSVVLRGSILTMTFARTSTKTAPFNNIPNAPAPHPKVVVEALHDGAWAAISLGRLTPGAAVLRAPMPCTAGCTVRQIGFANDAYTWYSGRTTITSMATDRQPAGTFAAALRETSNWQSDPVGAEPGLPVVARPRGTPSGLAVRFRDYTGQETAAFLPADGPPLLPGIVAARIDATALPAFQRAVDGTGLDGAGLPLVIVGRAVALPSSVDDGVLVDLATAARFTDPADSVVTSEVWLSSGAGPAVVSGLIRAGLVVTGVQHIGPGIDRSLAEAPVRVVIASGAAVALLVLLALAAVCSGAAIDGQRRSSFARVLADAGYPLGRVRRLFFEEVAMPSAAAVVVGTVAGALAVVVAGSRLPLFAASAGPPIDAGTPWLIVALAGLGLIMLTTGCSVALSRIPRQPPGGSR